VKSLFPLQCSDDIRADRDFYTGLFELSVVFENDWYVLEEATYRSIGSPRYFS
jgi:hypothetical protein